MLPITYTLKLMHTIIFHSFMAATARSLPASTLFTHAYSHKICKDSANKHFLLQSRPILDSK